jgi:small subunit ribosomal protein S1
MYRDTDTEGKIVRMIEKGVIVELPAGVDGFVPSSQLATKQVRNIPEILQGRRHCPCA